MSNNEREKLSIKEAEEIISGWIEEISENLPPHQRALPWAACKKIMTEALAQRMQEAVQRGWRDKEAVIRHYAAQDIANYLQTREPQGLYNPKALITLDGKQMIEMSRATHEHVQQWRDYLATNPEAGCNAGNIEYADTRLAVWADEKTLGELEALYSSES
jgi:hypothetical protein